MENSPSINKEAVKEVDLTTNKDVNDFFLTSLLNEINKNEKSFLFQIKTKINFFLMGATFSLVALFLLFFLKSEIFEIPAYLFIAFNIIIYFSIFSERNDNFNGDFINYPTLSKRLYKKLKINDLNNPTNEDIINLSAFLNSINMSTYATDLSRQLQKDNNAILENYKGNTSDFSTFIHNADVIIYSLHEQFIKNPQQPLNLDDMKASIQKTHKTFILKSLNLE